jgi:hypothetical protein
MPFYAIVTAAQIESTKQLKDLGHERAAAGEAAGPTHVIKITGRFTCADDTQVPHFV